MCALVSLKVLNKIISSALLRPSKSSRNNMFSTGIEFFLITILVKDSIFDVWHCSEYGNKYGCKILAR